jgi:sugar phosphate permease
MTGSNAMVGGLIVVGGIVGTMLGGWLADRLRRNVRGAYFAVCGFSAAAAGVVATVMFGVPSMAALSALLFLSLLLVFIPNGPVNTILMNSVPANVRATASALSIFCIHFFGDAGSPFLIGKVAQVVGMQRAVLLVPATVALGGGLWLFGRRSAIEN